MGVARVSDPRRSTGWPPSGRPSSGSWIKRKKAFVLPATIFFLAWYFGFILLAGYAPDFMGEEFLTDGLTVGYVLALTQFVMVWGSAAWYLRKADRRVRPARQARRPAGAGGVGGAAIEAAPGRSSGEARADGAPPTGR